MAESAARRPLRESEVSVARTLNGPSVSGMYGFPDRRKADPAGSRSDEPLRVLVADDDDNYRAYVVALTRKLGYSVEIARDGEEALARLRQSHFDVAVIDHNMPRLTGVEVIAQVRADDALKEIYAVMLTANDAVEMKLEALSTGFDDFLIKQSSELEIAAKLLAGRRIAARHRELQVTLHDLYGMATRDELTGVFNRRFFISEAERLVTSGTELTIVLFDLDDFKVVNDTYGHLAGDRVLRDVGGVFQRSTRSEDLIARWGGDEFVLAIAHQPLDSVERITDRLASDLRALQWTANTELFRVGVTTGMASSHVLQGCTVGQLLDAADRDLYKNKWVRRHPDEKPELYEYPAADRKVDLVVPLARPPQDEEKTGERA